MNPSYTESLGEWSVYFLVADYFKCGKVEVESPHKYVDFAHIKYDSPHEGATWQSYNQANTGV